jgi:hypothetical protein
VDGITRRFINEPCDPFFPMLPLACKYLRPYIFGIFLIFEIGSRGVLIGKTCVYSNFPTKCQA